MELKKVKELINLMKENDLVELEVVDGDSKVHLKCPGADVRVIQQQAPVGAVSPAVPAVAPVALAADSEQPATEDDNLSNVTSPIVGTYYHASSPDSDPFVKVGDQVNTDTVVAIVEAMKVMNEIKAEVSGTIVEICCKDGQAVEFGETLFKVRP